MNNNEPFQKSIILVFLTLLTACVNAPTAAPISASTPTLTAAPSPTPFIETQVVTSPPPKPTCQFVSQENSPQPDPNKTNYNLDVSLDYDNHFLSVSQRITYTNNTDRNLTELPLVVSALRDENVFSLVSVQLSQKFHKTNILIEDAKIQFLLEPPLVPGETLVADLIYELQVPQHKGALGYTPRQMLLADWYPFIPPFIEGMGWLINSPGAVGEHQVYPLSDVSLNLQLLPSEKELVVAASAPISAQREKCYQYSASDVRNFSLAVSPEYHLASKTNAMVTVKIYTFPEHAELGTRAADVALQAWETFTHIYGPNPRSFMSMVEAEIEDGLECDGLFYLSDWYLKTADASSQNYFELLVVHETSHQWLYALVHNDQAQEPWLDEALATYSELLFYEKHHPELVQWWWDYRVNAYSPSGYVNATIYDFDSYREYINAVYLMGARFIDTLRQSVGEPNFHAFLSRYVQSGQGDIRSASDFFTILAEFSPDSLSHLKSGFFK